MILSKNSSWCRERIENMKLYKIIKIIYFKNETLYLKNYIFQSHLFDLKYQLIFSLKYNGRL